MSLIRICLALLCAASTAARGEGHFGSPDDFAPAVNGPVHDLVVTALDFVIIVGEFTEVDGERCGGIAYLESSGALHSLFNPGTGANGPIHHIAIDETSGFPSEIFIAGEFTEFNGTPVNGFCKLDDRGNINPTFDAGSGPDGRIHCLDCRDRVLAIGGDFQNYNGTPAPYLALVDDRRGTLLNDFANTPPPAGPVLTLDLAQHFLAVGGNLNANRPPYPGYLELYSVQGFGANKVLRSSYSSPLLDGPVHKVLFDRRDFPRTVSLFGGFTEFDNQPRNGYVNLDTRGSIYNDTITYAGGMVSDAAQLDSISTLFVAGGFQTVNGFALPGIAAFKPLRPRISSDPAPRPPDFRFWQESGPNAAVNCIGVTADELLYVGGSFTTFDGKNRSYVARLRGPLGDRLPGSPQDLTAGATHHDSIGLRWRKTTDAERYSVQLLDSDGITWNQVDSTRSDFAIAEGLQPDTEYTLRVLARNLNGSGPPSEEVTARTRSAPWSGPGQVDRAFSDQHPGLRTGAIEELRDGRILIAGSFTALQETPRRYLAILHPDGTVDESFDPGDSLSPNGVDDVVEQPDGRIILCGSFNSYRGNDCPGICRILPTGEFDSTFQSPLTGSSDNGRALLLLSDGRIVLGGSFNEVASQPQYNLAVLLPNGSPDPAFIGQTVSPGTVNDLLACGDDSFLVEGPYQWSGISVRDYFRVRPDGTRDPSWVLPLGRYYSLSKMVRDPAGRYYAVGNIEFRIGETTHREMARLLPDGSVDPTFVPPTVDDRIEDIVLLRDGRPLILGDFTSVDGQFGPGLALLREDGSHDPGFAAPEFLIRYQQTFWSAPSGGMLVDAANRINFSGFSDVRAAFGGTDLLRLLPLQPDSLPAPESPRVQAEPDYTILVSWLPVEGAFRTHLQHSPDGAQWTTLVTLDSPISSYRHRHLQPGTRHFYRLVASAGAVSSAPGSAGETTVFTPLQEWIAASGVPGNSDPASDPHGSGSSLLLTYALGLPATASSAGELRFFQSFGRFLLVYSRARTDLHYEVKQSQDGISWTAHGVDQGPPGLFGIASVPLTSTTTLLRLEVQAR